MAPPLFFAFVGGGRTASSKAASSYRSGHPNVWTVVAAVTTVAVSLALAGCAVAKICQQPEQRRKGSSEDDEDLSPAPSSSTTPRPPPQRQPQQQPQPQQQTKQFGSWVVGLAKTHPHQNLSNPRTQMQMEFHKQVRWQKLIPKLIMKRPMYDNFRMYDPSGTLLCTISQKKAHWYVRKNLATWNDDNNDDNDRDNSDASSSSRTAIQLRFEPKKKKKKQQQPQSKPSKVVSTTSKEEDDDLPLSEQYNRSIKQNRCVACGSTEQYMRHYVVPSCYRIHFPHVYKTHMPHDVVLLCPSCQIPAQKANQRQQRQLEREYNNNNSNNHRHRRLENEAVSIDDLQHHNIIDDTTNKYVINSHLQHLQSIATALTKWKDRLPPDRVNEYETTLCEWFQTSKLNDQHLQQAQDLEYRSLNPQYVSGPERVVQSITASSGLEEFVRDWRRLFVTTMHPQYLPPGWSVDSPVRCDLP